MCPRLSARGAAASHRRGTAGSPWATAMRARCCRSRRRSPCRPPPQARPRTTLPPRAQSARAILVVCVARAAHGPRGQMSQSMLPSVGWYVPGSQRGHAMQGRTLQPLPAKHCKQSDCSVLLAEPSGHAVHPIAPWTAAPSPARTCGPYWHGQPALQQPRQRTTWDTEPGAQATHVHWPCATRPARAPVRGSARSTRTNVQVLCCTCSR
jgi:hypothetical protein